MNSCFSNKYLFCRNRKVKKTVGFGSPISKDAAILDQTKNKENFEQQLKINDDFLKVTHLILIFLTIPILRLS